VYVWWGEGGLGAIPRFWKEELELHWNERGSSWGNDMCYHSVGKASTLVEIWVWISIPPMYRGDIYSSIK